MQNVSTPFNFVAIGSGPGDICGPGTNCEGYSLEGAYGISTDALGVNELIVDATVTGARRFRKTGMYGVGWGISYGKDNSSTEAYLALWQYQ